MLIFKLNEQASVALSAPSGQYCNNYLLGQTDTIPIIFNGDSRGIRSFPD